MLALWRDVKHAWNRPKMIESYARGERAKQRRRKERKGERKRERERQGEICEDVPLYQCKWDASVFPLIQIAE